MLKRDYAEVKKLLGDLVKEARLQKNLSQSKLAELADVSYRTVSDIENYIGNPRLETLYQLISFLNISIDSIFLQEMDDPMINQILIELENISDRNKRLVLYALRGLLLGLREDE